MYLINFQIKFYIKNYSNNQIIIMRSGYSNHFLPVSGSPYVSK